MNGIDIRVETNYIIDVDITQRESEPDKLIKYINAYPNASLWTVNICANGNVLCTYYNIDSMCVTTIVSNASTIYYAYIDNEL